MRREEGERRAESDEFSGIEVEMPDGPSFTASKDQTQEFRDVGNAQAHSPQWAVAEHPMRSGRSGSGLWLVL